MEGSLIKILGEITSIKSDSFWVDDGSGELKVTLKKSKYGRIKNHLHCVHGLGLRKIGQTVMVEDTPSNRGMINRVNYLLLVEEVK